jgi:hypothetical protein
MDDIVIFRNAWQATQREPAQRCPIRTYSGIPYPKERWYVTGHTHNIYRINAFYIPHASFCRASDVSFISRLLKYTYAR